MYNPGVRFEWDDAKARANEPDHGISIEVFDDDNAIGEYDETHSDVERRFHIIGFSSRRLLFVAYAERQGAT